MAEQRVSGNIKGENIWETESTKTKEAKDTGKNRTTLRFKSINREQINAFCMCFYFLTNIFLWFACLLAFFLSFCSLFFFKFWSNTSFWLPTSALSVDFSFLLSFFPSFFLSIVVVIVIIFVRKIVWAFDKVMKWMQ